MAKDVKAKDNKKKRKQSGIARWWRETIGELRKVTWPTPKDAIQLTKVVLIVLVAMSIVLGIFDFLFSKFIALLLA
ncbi:MAG: preprotein translocase subunit SecE [Anaerolineaceae bacterium]|nr:preprotein translocase subunit SecE [Anaerolineaceae bacterium]